MPDKTNKLSITAGYLREDRYCRIPKFDAGEKNDKSGAPLRYSMTFCQNQFWFNTNELVDKQIAKNRMMVIIDALYEPRLQLGRNTISENFKEGEKRLKISSTILFGAHSLPA